MNKRDALVVTLLVLVGLGVVLTFILPAPHPPIEICGPYSVCSSTSVTST